MYGWPDAVKPVGFSSVMPAGICVKTTVIGPGKVEIRFVFTRSRQALVAPAAPCAPPMMMLRIVAAPERMIDCTAWKRTIRFLFSRIKKMSPPTQPKR